MARGSYAFSGLGTRDHTDESFNKNRAVRSVLPADGPRCAAPAMTLPQAEVRRPRLLFLCQTLPYPPDGGVWIRTYHVLRILARTFDVTALCFERSGLGGRQPREQRHHGLEALRAFGAVDAVPVPQTLSRARYVWDHLRSLLSGRVYTRFLYDSREFRERLVSLLARQNCDLIHMDSLDLAGYLPSLGDLPVVCVHHNVESELLARRASVERAGWRRRYLARQARLMEREEREWCRKVTRNVAVSPADAASLASIAPGAAVSIVPNGVDVDEFRPAPGANDRITYVGGTAWLPNLDALDFFCAAILPRLRARRALPRIQWIGAATAKQQQHYYDRFGVELTGHVPDVRPFIRDSICSIVPLRVGGGTRIKILNAWAMGRAVVSTSIGCEGLDATNGSNILVADDPDAFADAVQRVLDDGTLRTELGARARRTVEQTYSWDVIGAFMTDTYLRLVEARNHELTRTAVRAEA
jgi:glycosyltransferase involved in cell wall biosynthesis